MGGSSSKSSSKPVDMTPSPFKDLQQPFADVLKGMIDGYEGSKGTEAVMEGYKGPTNTPITSNEQSLLNAIMGKVGGGNSATGGSPAGTGGPMQPPKGPGVTGTMPPLTLPGQKPTQPVAPQSNASPFTNPLTNAAQSGASADAVNQSVDQLDIAGAGNPQTSLADYRAQLGQASQTGAYGDSQNPFLQSYIQSAQRQTQQAMEETLSRSLPGRFTQAGHLVQPGGSSAFDRAAAIAFRGGADALGDISTKIGYQAYADAADREASALEAQAGRNAQQGLQTQNLTSTAQQNAFDRAMSAGTIKAGLETSAANNTKTAAETDATKAQSELIKAQTGTEKQNTNLTGAQVQAQEVNTMIQALQAEALPRLIEDLGVERGMETFNQRVNSLLSVMGIASGVTRPVVGNSSSSSSGSFSLK